MEGSSSTQFVYHAVSNASMNVYPDNKPQHFKTLLPAPWNLEGEWEVGLSSITYFKLWQQLPKSTQFTVAIFTKNIATKEESFMEYEVEVPEKRFTSNAHLIDRVNFHIDNCINATMTAAKVEGVSNIGNKHVEFELTNTDPQYVKRKDLGFARDDRRLLLSKQDRELWRMMGFSDDVFEIKGGDVAKNPISINAHFPSLYVYCPIIEYVGVGDTRAPLLATVPIVGKEAEVQYVRCEKPLYVPVNRKHITELEFAIKDDAGQDVQFIVGKLNMILHFRKRA